MTDQNPSSIKDESSYQQTLAILSTQNKPPRILCFLMNMLESYRQARKMGWSRAWNKYGVMTFQSLKLNADEDAALMVATERAVPLLSHIPAEAEAFIRQLLGDQERLMGFLFVSEYLEEKQRYESLTLSLGAKVKENARARERFDLIFDCPIVEGEAKPLSRIRVYVDPYREGEKVPLYQVNITGDGLHDWMPLFGSLCDLSWGNDAHKLWHHWTSNYIDYFGERSVALPASHFYLASGERLPAQL